MAGRSLLAIFSVLNRRNEDTLLSVQRGDVSQESSLRLDASSPSCSPHERSRFEERVLVPLLPAAAAYYCTEYASFTSPGYIRVSISFSPCGLLFHLSPARGTCDYAGYAGFQEG